MDSETAILGCTLVIPTCKHVLFECFWKILLEFCAMSTDVYSIHFLCHMPDNTNLFPRLNTRRHYVVSAT
jgi:calcineurin-like phosphoesterase family protein